MYFGMGPFGFGLGYTGQQQQQQHQHQQPQQNPFFGGPPQQQQNHHQQQPNNGGFLNLFENFMNPFFQVNQPRQPQQ